MGRMKDWIMDMEEHVDDAVMSGAKSTDDVVAYVQTQMGICDESYIRSYTEEIMGPGDEGYATPTTMTGLGVREFSF